MKATQKIHKERITRKLEVNRQLLKGIKSTKKRGVLRKKLRGL